MRTGTCNSAPKNVRAVRYGIALLIVVALVFGGLFGFNQNFAIATPADSPSEPVLPSAEVLPTAKAGEGDAKNDRNSALSSPSDRGGEVSDLAPSENSDTHTSTEEVAGNTQTAPRSATTHPDFPGASRSMENAVPVDVKPWEFSRGENWKFPVTLVADLPREIEVVDRVELTLAQANTMKEITNAKVEIQGRSQPVTVSRQPSGAGEIISFKFAQPIPAKYFSKTVPVNISFHADVAKGLAFPGKHRYAVNTIMKGASFQLVGGWGEAEEITPWDPEESGGIAKIRVRVSQMRNSESYVPAVGATLRLHRADNPEVTRDPYWGKKRPAHDSQWGTPGSVIDKDWARCTVAADGYCTFHAPAPTRESGDNGAIYWVVPDTAPDGYRVIDKVRVGFSGANGGSYAKGNSHALDYAYRTTALFAGDTLTSGEGDPDGGFMTYDSSLGYVRFTDEGIILPRSSSGHMTFAKNNPALPDRCGINVGLILDTSQSMGGTFFSKSTADRAVKGIYDFVGDIQDTGINLGFITFADEVGDNNQEHQILEPIPMDAAGVARIQNIVGENQRKSKIRFADDTNWDDAIRTVAQHNESNPAKAYDVVIVVTDGNPTRSAVPGQRGPTTAGDFAMIENTVMSANWLKGTADGTRMIGIGVGTFSRGGIVRGPSDSTLSERNFRAVFGPKGSRLPVDSAEAIAQQDWLIFDGQSEDQLAEALSEIALAGCQASVVVEKETQIDGGDITPGGSGWHFDASGLTEGFTFSDNPASDTMAKKTGDDSKVEFRLDLAKPTLRNGTLTLIENIAQSPEPDSGWDIVRRGTPPRNAICVDQSQPGAPAVSVVDQGKYGFTVAGLSNDSRVHCKVLNAKKSVEPEFRVEKAVRGFPSGTSGDPITLNHDGTAEVTYEVKVTNSGKVAGSHPQITDRITVPDGFEITSVKLDGVEQGTSGSFTIASSLKVLEPIVEGRPESNSSVTYTVVLSVKAGILESVDWTKAGVCQTQGAGDPGAGGLFNLVEMTADSDGPDNNDSCVPVKPAAPGYLKLLKVDANDHEKLLTGASFAVYPSDSSGKLNRQQPVAFANDRFEVRPGLYGIVETQAPESYSLLPGPVYVEIFSEADGLYIALLDKNQAGELTRAAKMPFVELIDPATSMAVPAGTQHIGADADGVLTLRIADVKTGKLPMAGGAGVMPIVVFGAILALIAIYVTWRRSATRA